MVHVLHIMPTHVPMSLLVALRYADMIACHSGFQLICYLSWFFMHLPLCSSTGL